MKASLKAARTVDSMAETTADKWVFPKAALMAVHLVALTVAQKAVLRAGNLVDSTDCAMVVALVVSKGVLSVVALVVSKVEKMAA